MYNKHIWKKEQTDCRNCSACEDMIISDMYRLFHVFEELIPFSQPIKLNGIGFSDIVVTFNGKEIRTKGITMMTKMKRIATKEVICSSCHELME